MFLRTLVVAVLGLLSAGIVSASPAWGQYSVVSTPFHNIGDSFFERNGVGFGFSIPGGGPPGNGRSTVVGLQPNGQFVPGGNINFGQGGFGVAVPPFGGHVPGQDATGGFAVLGGNGGGLFFNFAAGQGNTRTNTSTTPTVVVPNGGQGTIIDTIQRPFVTGVIPVVGGGGAPVMMGGFPSGGFPGGGFGGQPVVSSPLSERIARMYEQGVPGGAGERAEAFHAEGVGGAAAAPAASVSSAARGDIGVAEIQARQAAEEAAADQELQAWLERAQGLEAQGKGNVAKIWYQRAYRQASGELRERIGEKIRLLSN